MEYTGASKRIKKARRILICVKSFSTTETTLALVALQKQLQILGKEVDIVATRKPRKRTSEILSKYGVQILKKIESGDYTVSINYKNTPIEKVTYDTDEKSGKIIFHITPAGKSFNFDNIEFNSGGKKYDLTITYGLDTPKEMGKIYEENQYLFKETDVIGIGGENGDFNIPIETSYSKTVYQLLKTTGEIDKEVLELLTQSTMHDLNLLEDNPRDISTLISLIEEGADLQMAITNQYYSKSFANIQVQTKLMQNLNVNEELRIAWSLVELGDLESNGIDKNSLDVKGRIPFNSATEFDIAIAAYQIEDKNIRMVIESNIPEKYSAKELAGVFGGSGSRTHAGCIAKEMNTKNFEKELVKVIKDLWKIEDNPVVISGKGMDNVGNLTNSNGNSKTNVVASDTLESE
jgi:hypothetical protein